MVQQSKRIQTSVLNGVEHKALIWLADRQPAWMTSDILSGIGVIGAFLIAAGYLLSDLSIHWIWLSSFGFVVHWYGDSLDGTLARVRNCQRPIYGYYLDHTLDAVTEGIMFLGIGCSAILRLDIALAIFVIYLMLTLNVSINAHLKSEFKLTYAKLGPTEFRVIMILLNTAYYFITPLREFQTSIYGFNLKALDVAGLIIILILGSMYVVTVWNDLKGYDQMDPAHKPEK